MTGTQYKNVAQWTLANGAAEASDSAAAAKAIFDNMGVPFPAGSCGEILLTLMSEDYMGWRACTHLEAQEYANAGTAAVGIDGEHVVVILPEEGEGLVGAVVQANATSYARQASDISTAERITMQFYTNSASATTTLPHYRILVCHQTKNDCYKAATSIGTVKGIVVHSTGANNKTLKRYVDCPSEVGVNAYGNTWNQSGVKTMVHAFIGLDKNNTVTIVNTLPYNYACWGVDEGTNGSYNYAPNGHIQFEICEDGLTDSEYFTKAVLGAAVEYCVYLCRQFHLPVNSIVSHKEAYDLGYASNHADIDHWLKKFGKTMDNFRSLVKVRL